MYILKIDEHGRIIIPSELREQLCGEISIDVVDDKIILRPVH